MEVELKLKKELEAGRMLGPFPQPIFDYYCISPLGLTEKKVPGKYRLIQDLSATLEGLSVNNAIPVEAGAVSYNTVDNVVRMIQGYGQVSVLGKKFCEALGIPIVEHKTEWGTTLVFLGIELDTIKMEARRPEEKLKKCLGLLKRHGQSKKITVKQLESLTGLLNFACSVIAPGRPFLPECIL